MDEKLLYSRESYKLRGMIYSVRNKLKLGWSEEVYHQAMVHLAEQNRVPILSKPKTILAHRGVQVHAFEPDIIAWDKIILELKALPYTQEFLYEHYAQLIHYLKFFQKRLGFLVNFSTSELQIKRVIWAEPPLEISQDFSNIAPSTFRSVESLINKLREIILDIGHQYGLGYPETIYRKLIAIESRYHALSCLEETEVMARWEGAELAKTTTPHLLISDKVLVYVRSLLENPTSYDFARTATYLSSLGLQVGLVVNFGRKQLQIIGVSTNKLHQS